MLAFPSTDRLQVTDEELKKIRDSFNVTRESLNEDLDNIIEWFKIQPHFPDVVPDRDILERLFIGQKCSMQRTKASLEMKYFRKYALPEFFMKRDTRSPKVSETMDYICYLPTPKMCPDFTRLIVLKLTSNDASKFDMFNYFYNEFLIQEIRANEDYSLGVKVLVDLENATLGHLLKCNPDLIAQCEKVMKKGLRIFGIHFINGPKIIEKILTLVKQVLQPKLVARMHVHNSIDDLQNAIPSEILPKDYGGKQPSLNELKDLWKEHLTSDVIRNYFIEEDKYVTDEEKRPRDNICADLSSVAGSFRKLNID